MNIFKTHSYTKIGLIISLIAHIGIFALGGYIMSNLTKPVAEPKTASANDDITYVEVQQPSAETSEVSMPANPESDVVVNEDKAITPEQEINQDTPQEIKPAEQTSEPKPEPETSKQAPNTNSPSKGPVEQQEKDSSKLPTYKDIKIPMKKIEPSRLDLDENDLKNSIDLQPTIIYKAAPEYDHSWIPQGEEIVVVIAYTLDSQGNVTDVYVQSSAQASAKLLGATLAPEIDEAINTRAIQAVLASKIKPPKNPKANGPYQIPISFKN